MELVYVDGKKEPCTTSEIIAECAEVQHHTITRLIREHKSDFETLGILGFEIHKLDARGQPKKSYILNEQQATLLITYLKNTEPVREFKKNLVKAFFELRNEVAARGGYNGIDSLTSIELVRYQALEDMVIAMINLGMTYQEIKIMVFRSQQGR